MSSIMKEDWIDVELQEVFETVTGNTPSKKETDNYGQDIPFIKPPDITNSAIKSVSEYLSNKGKKKARVLPQNSILVTCIGNLGRIGYNNDEVAFNQQINAILPTEYIDYKFTFYQAQSGSFRNQLESLSTSTTVALVNKSSFNSIKIDIAPLPIQRAIVSKIEALFSDLDNGIANLKKAQEQLKIYRQAVLKKAFEGELTAAWRENIVQTGHALSQLPTAEELLLQIKQERQNHYNQQIEDWKKAVKEWEKNGKVGSKPSKPTQPKELPPLKKEELEELPNLPVGWAWCRNLNVSTKITDGEHITPKREKSGYYLLSARNIQNGYISYSNVDYVGEDEYLRIRKRCNPEFGDILISCSGSVGRISLVPKNSNFVMVRSVALVKTNTKIYNPKFLEYLFLSPELQSQIEEGKKATAQANLFLDPIGKLNVIVCSLQEQTQIVQEIERRLSVCDKMEQSITESLEKAEALRQSILKKAFEGKLLSEAEIAQCKQAADYEPASELLKKIKTEKLAKMAKQKTNKQKNTS